MRRAKTQEGKKQAQQTVGLRRHALCGGDRQQRDQMNVNGQKYSEGTLKDTLPIRNGGDAEEKGTPISWLFFGHTPLFAAIRQSQGKFKLRSTT
ncbi:hypothetical protein E4U59_005950 [Claviceps monticola]|nr:hypothetical protein E4U59_005950 [Claviceps monticola]